MIGDKIFLSQGDLLPADCLLGPGECSIDQSMLTGETIPVLKTEGSKLYMGSICKKGEVEAYVCKTGQNTYFCKGASLTSKVEQKGKVQKILTKIAFFLILISSILTSIIFIVLLLNGNEFLESLSLSVVLLIIAFPIAMQVVCTTTLAVGAKALNKKQAVVSRLSSIEELAGMEVLCISKSGFLTKKEPIVQQPILIQSQSTEEVILIALLASKKDRDSQNSIDRCICEHAIEKCRINFEIFEEEDFFPYNSKSKRCVSIIRNTKTGYVFKCCKVSPQVLLALTEK